MSTIFIHVGKLALLLCACALAGMAAAQSVSMGDVRQLIDAADDAALMQLLQRKAPVGASNRALNDFYSQQTVIARNLSLPEETITWLTEWSQAVPAGQSNPDPRISLWRALAGSDRLAEAGILGEEVLAAASTGGVPVHEFVRHASWLAWDYVRMGRLQDAEQLLRNIEAKLRSMPDHLGGEDPFWRAFARTNFHMAWGGLHAARGHIDEAVSSWALAAVETDREVGLRHTVSAFQREEALPRAVMTRLNIAGNLAARGRLFDADRLAFEAQQLMARFKLSSPFLKLRAQGNSALLLLARKDLAAARARADEVLPQMVAVERGRLGAGTRYLAGLRLQILLAQEDWPEALRAFDQIDQIASGNPAVADSVRFFLPRALTYAATGRAGAALPVIDAGMAEYEQAVGPRHLFTALARGVRGIVLSKLGEARHAEAVAELGAASQALADPSTPGRNLLELGNLAQIRKLVLEHQLELSFANGRQALAFSAGEMLRDSSTQRALVAAAARSAAGTQGLSDEIRRDQDADSELRALYDYLARQSGLDERRQVPAVTQKMRARIAELEAQHTAARLEIERRFPQYARLVDPGATSAADIASKLRPGEAMLSVVATSDGLWSWLVKPDGSLAAHRVALSNADAAKLVGRVRASIELDAAPSLPPFATDAAAQLHGALIAPFDTALSGTAHLIVAAGGVLGRVPFGALVSTPPQAGAPAHYLIERLAVSHVPTATAWLALQAAGGGARSPEPLLAWGDPRFGRDTGAAVTSLRHIQLTRAASDPTQAAPVASVSYDQLPALPETREELQAIAASLKADPQRDLRLGAAATRASVLASSQSGELRRKRVVAFATHGLMAGDLPNLDQPALALSATANAQTDPLAPLLKLDDVLGLKMNADWVVLSACNTAAADGKAEEALSGLTRGFFYAGARSLLVTHWAVETESAKLLTTATFEHYTAHADAGKAESLRQAMLKVMEMPTYRHPAFWAPYALVGDGAR